MPSIPVHRTPAPVKHTPQNVSSCKLAKAQRTVTQAVHQSQRLAETPHPSEPALVGRWGHGPGPAASHDATAQGGEGGKQPAAGPIPAGAAAAHGAVGTGVAFPGHQGLALALLHRLHQHVTYVITARHPRVCRLGSETLLGDSRALHKLAIANVGGRRPTFFCAAVSTCPWNVRLSWAARSRFMRSMGVSLAGCMA